MTTERAESSKLTAKQKLAELVKRGPASPEFQQATIAYLDKCIEAVLEQVGEVLTSQYPSLSSEISQKIKILAAHKFQPLPHHNFVLENGRILLESPRGKRTPLNRTLQSVYFANPDLGIFHYTIGLLPPRNEKEARGRFPWFNKRLSKIVEVGQFPLDSPIVEIIAVGYITQVAKNLGVSQSKQLLKKALLFGGIANVDQIEKYLENLGEEIRQIRKDQGFIAKGLATINEITSKANLSEDQVQLLVDLAFIRSRAFHNPKEFAEMLEPLIQSVAEGNWQEAYTHRDFLLSYFADSFPEWRKRRFEKTTGQASFENFRELVGAIRDGQLVLDEETIPLKYRKAFESLLPKKVERATRTKDAEIRRNSIGLSNAVVRELAQETKEQDFTRHLLELFRDNSQPALRILLRQDILANQDDFYTLVKPLKPKTSELKIQALYRQLKDQLRNLSTPGPPHLLRGTRTRNVLAVELVGNDQVYWYQTESYVTIRDQDSRVHEGYKNYANFGSLIEDIIIAACQPKPEHPALSKEKVQVALGRAYEKVSQSHRRVKQFTLTEYLRAIIGRTKFGVARDQSDPVIQFINQLEEDSNRKS